tara:strand:+ start:52 stop:237 length:186 start_codon:yes stop_codon:yes gene_type:complete
MIIIIQSDILLSDGVKKTGDVIDVDDLIGQDLIGKGIAVEKKELKLKKETKELKLSKKITK